MPKSLCNLKYRNFGTDEMGYSTIPSQSVFSMLVAINHVFTKSYLTLPFAHLGRSYASNANNGDLNLAVT